MQDLAILTGGTVVSTDMGMKLEEVTPADLGSCKKITVTKNDCIVLDGGGDKDGIEERCAVIRSPLNQPSPTMRGRSCRSVLPS